MRFFWELNYLTRMKLLKESLKDEIWKKEKCLIKATVNIFVSTDYKTEPSTHSWVYRVLKHNRKTDFLIDLSNQNIFNYF